MCNGSPCLECQDCKSRVLLPPEIQGALPPLAGDTAWLIPVSLQGQPLAVVVADAWPGFEDDPNVWIRFVMYLGETIVDTVQIDPPYDEATHFPVHLTVPLDQYNLPGIYTLKYRVLFEDQNFADSPPLVIEIDHRAPNGDNRGDPLVFPPDVVSGGLTEAWLALNGDKLPVTVPRWPDMKLEDEVLFFWGGPDEAEPVARLVIDASHMQPGSPIEFSYSGDILREKGNGLLNGYYVLRDRAGNENDPSAPVPINVIDLPATPGDFPAPVVPLASSDRLIDLDDARTGVTVEVGPISDTAAGDTLQVTWNGRPLPLITLPDNPQWPQRVAVSWAVLSADGFAGVVPCEVVYQWQRGSGPGKTSLPTRFDVNLSVAGPDPEGPDPINPNLDTPVVKGLTADNVLVGADYGNDARVVVALYANPVAGELLELHWGDHPQVAASYRVQVADQPGQEIAFTVPWSIIESVGNNPALPVWYWASNGVNRQRSEDTEVLVAVMPLEGLEPVSFPDANLWGYISCEHAPWNGIRVSIPGNPALMAEGDSVQLSWQLCTGTTGENPITEIVLFPARVLTATEAQEGFEWLMDRFTDLVLPIQLERGSANVSYRLTKVDGTLGIATNKVLRIDLVIPGNTKPCDGTL